ESGTLEVFVGGEPDLFERWRPLLSTLGTVLRVGPVGAGTAAKLVANTTLVGVIDVLGEALAVGDALGLSRTTTFAVLGKTPLAQQAERRRPSIESADYPSRYALSPGRRDAARMVGGARKAGLDPRVRDGAREWLAQAGDAGLGGADYSAVLVRILDRSRMSASQE